VHKQVLKKTEFQITYIKLQRTICSLIMKKNYKVQLYKTMSDPLLT